MSLGTIQVNDYSTLATSLNPDIKKSQVHNTIHQYNTYHGNGTYIRHVAQVKPLVIRCKVGEEAAAAAAICKVLNYLKEFGDEDDNEAIQGFLGPVIAQMDLARIPGEDPQQAIICYPALSSTAQLIYEEDFGFNSPEANPPTLEAINAIFKD